ncbi:MAG: endonuclease [Bryobacterales bacterium]|nr:endonuclease [Bryobacterales bacterium]
MKWTIPIEITITVGGAEPQTITAVAAVPQVAVTATSAALAATSPVEVFRQTRKAIQEDASNYYDEAADSEARESYYAGIDVGAGNLYQSLNQLVTQTHKSPKPYAPSQHLYPMVDLHPSGELISIYSGASMDAESVIRADAAMESAMEQAVNALKSQESFATEEAMFEAVAALEANFTLNCEHVVPQSWFKKQEPMKGDLHHLFACESKCNGFRGNTPYFDFPDFEERIIQDCGRLESGENHFEPRGGKGAVARATLYFLLRHPKKIRAAATTYTAERMPTLLRWHKEHPVTLYELHRNRAIEQKQGNRNPLIDHPEWAEKVDFSLGLG